MQQDARRAVGGIAQQHDSADVPAGAPKGSLTPETDRARWSARTALQKFRLMLHMRISMAAVTGQEMPAHHSNGQTGAIR